MRDLLLFAFGVGDALGRGSFAVQFCFWQWNSLRPWTKLPLSSDVYSCFRFRKGGLGPGPTPSAERQLVVLSDSAVRLVSLPVFDIGMFVSRFPSVFCQAQAERAIHIMPISSFVSIHTPQLIYIYMCVLSYQPTDSIPISAPLHYFMSCCPPHGAPFVLSFVLTSTGNEPCRSYLSWQALPI